MSAAQVCCCARAFEPGGYLLRALEQGTGNLAGEAKFRVTSLWTRDELGPSHWFTGSNELRASAGAWGGGPAGPQNMSVSPQSGTWRIAILFVDTSSQRYSTDAATIQGHRDRWLDETVNGVLAGGVTRSVAHFYREVSYGNFDVSAQAFGPVSLSGNFDSYFNTDGSPKGGFYQACFTAGDGLIDYRNFDTLLCVSQSVPASGSTPMRSAWPYASIGRWGPWTTADGNLNRGVISMPNEWGTTDAREIFDTLSHELGHNLGLGDQYTPGVTGRNVGGWDMMHADDPLPHFSLVHRMMHGWIPAGCSRRSTSPRSRRRSTRRSRCIPSSRVRRHRGAGRAWRSGSRTAGTTISSTGAGRPTRSATAHCPPTTACLGWTRCPRPGLRPS
jgi:M6 family metalloprotease-like protein